MFVTKQGNTKLVDGGEFDVSRRSVAATKLVDDDEVISVHEIHDISTVVFRSENGFFLRFNVTDIPEKKKGAVGVRGMRLGSKDSVRDVFYLKEADEQTIEHNGKSLVLDHLKITSRDTKGTKIRL